MNDALLAQRWYDAWNAHDLEGVLALYADDIEFSSPYISALGLSEDGVIEGKAMLRAYFELGLARIPDLKFTPESLCIGSRGHSLIYRNHRGERVVEHHELDPAGLILRADAAYETA